jgi:hypothetical protein
MFNNYNAGDTNLKINACSGGIYKTYKESWLDYLRLESSAMETMFGHYKYESDENIYYRDVIILQIVLTSKEDYVIAELIKKEDFEKYFERSDV